MMKALDEAGWPIDEQDVILMEDEVAKARKFLQQSVDLRTAANTKSIEDKENSGGKRRKGRKKRKGGNGSICNSDRSSASSRSSTSSRSLSLTGSRSGSRASSHSLSRSVSQERVLVTDRDERSLSQEHVLVLDRDVNVDEEILVYDDRASVVSSLTANTNRDSFFEVSASFQ